MAEVDPTSGGIYTVDLSQLKQLIPIIKAIEREGEHIDKPLKIVAIYMDRQTQKAFDDGGRESDTWPKLSDYTLAMRRHAGRAEDPKKILQVTGVLRGSVKFELMDWKSNRSIHGFTRTPYADKLQHGGTGHIDAVTIVPKNKKVLRFCVRGGGRSGAFEEVFAKRVVIPARDTKIPPRPFLKFYNRDVEFAVDRLTDFRDDIVEESNKGKETKQ